MKMRGNLELQLSLNTVKDAAEEKGLDAQHFLTLLDAAASGHFGV